MSRNIKSFTWIFTITKPVDLLHIRVTLYYRFRNGYQKFLVDVDTDVCAYYKNILGSALIDLVRKELEKYSSNVIHPCPYFGNANITGLPLTGALFNYIFLPSGDYKLVRMLHSIMFVNVNKFQYLKVINSTFGEQQTFGALLTAYFSVPAGKTVEDDNMG